MTLAAVIPVAIGGAIGASLRHLANQGIQRVAGTAFPWHTLAVNILGSALMGGLMVALAHKGGLRKAPSLTTGILGGCTTFSAFSMDTILLWERGQGAAAFVYVAASVLLSLAAFVLAATLTRSVLT